MDTLLRTEYVLQCHYNYLCALKGYASTYKMSNRHNVHDHKPIHQTRTGSSPVHGPLGNSIWDIGPLLTPVGQINERGAQIHSELQVPAGNFPASCVWASPSLQTSVVLQVCILYIALINNIHLLIFHLYENYAYISEYEVS